jgi:CelD/BcsL family acetyltransferase involved in cellulose biosynthesis
MAHDLGWVLTAYLDETPVAAAVFFEYKGTLVYKFAASDTGFSRHCPNHLLLWTALQWACRNDFHCFDWGRTDPEARGLRDFKNGWGAVEVPLTYSLISKTAPSPSSGRLTQLAGAVIRRSPAWVCRSIGEILYKYAA